MSRPLDHFCERKKTRGRVAQDDAELYRFVRTDNSSNRLAIIEIFCFVRSHARYGSGKLGELIHLPMAMRRQGHDRNTTDLLQSEVEVDEFDNVRQLHDDAVKRLEPF